MALLGNGWVEMRLQHGYQKEAEDQQGIIQRPNPEYPAGIEIVKIATFMLRTEKYSSDQESRQDKEKIHSRRTIVEDPSQMKRWYVPVYVRHHNHQNGYGAQHIELTEISWKLHSGV